MRIVVVGLGKVGRALTAQLTAENNDIVVIDQNPDLIEDIVNIYDVRGLAGNGGCYDVQKEAFEDGADLLIATDPDSDRMAVELPDGKGGFRPLNGNQTGAMLIAYMAESQKAAGTLPENGAMIKSIVTGDMGKTICKSYGIRVFETLTGFKNICGVIPRLEKEGYRYFFAYEESIGCAPGERVRDKDGIAAGLLMMEMAAFYKV